MLRHCSARTEFIGLNCSFKVKGRYSTIKTHLEHWLDFIKRDTKLKELELSDGEAYLYSWAAKKSQR
jgi:hypothetical protein